MVWDQSATIACKLQLDLALMKDWLDQHGDLGSQSTLAFYLIITTRNGVSCLMFSYHVVVQAGGSEEDTSAEAQNSHEEREDGEIVPPATPAEQSMLSLQARRKAAQAAAAELKVGYTWWAARIHNVCIRQAVC